MTGPGDMVYGGALGVYTRLAANAAATRKFLGSLGTGAAGQDPWWGVLGHPDLPVAYTVGAGAKNAYTAGLTPAITAYAAGLTLDLTIGAASNDAVSTLALNGMVAKPIVDRANGALTGGELVQGSTYRLVYDGTSFRLIGSTLAKHITDFDTAVRTNRLDQMAAPTASVPLNSQKITGLADPTLVQDAATKAYVDGAMIHAHVEMTPADVNGMYAAPKAIISAPGVNKLILVHHFALGLIFGVAAFASGGVPVLQYDATVNGAGTSVGGGALLAANITSSSTAVTRRTVVDSDTVALTGMSEKGIYFSNKTGAFTTGTNCKVLVDVYYTVINVN